MYYTVQITSYGWFTCDAVFHNEDGEITCPEFETVQEVADWIKEQ